MQPLENEYHVSKYKIIASVNIGEVFLFTDSYEVLCGLDDAQETARFKLEPEIDVNFYLRNSVINYNYPGIGLFSHRGTKYAFFRGDVRAVKSGGGSVRLTGIVYPLDPIGKLTPIMSFDSSNKD